MWINTVTPPHHQMGYRDAQALGPTDKRPQRTDTGAQAQPGPPRLGNGASCFRLSRRGLGQGCDLSRSRSPRGLRVSVSLSLWLGLQPGLSRTLAVLSSSASAPMTVSLFLHLPLPLGSASASADSAPSGHDSESGSGPPLRPQVRPLCPPLPSGVPGGTRRRPGPSPRPAPPPPGPRRPDRPRFVREPRTGRLCSQRLGATPPPQVPAALCLPGGPAPRPVRGGSSLSPGRRPRARPSDSWESPARHQEAHG